jgi:hypothetical protein
MNFIKITTPKGGTFVVPENSNRAFYEKINAQLKDERFKYKIEKATEDEAAAIAPVQRPQRKAIPVTQTDEYKQLKAFYEDLKTKLSEAEDALEKKKIELDKAKTDLANAKQKLKKASEKAPENEL